MESLRIVGLCVLAAAIYGIVHDQITARICLEYFTVYHPDIFHTQSPTLLAFGWGVLATWWVGLFLGVLLAIAARAGSRPRLAAPTLVPSLCKLLAVMAICALVAGVTGHLLLGFGMEYYNKTMPKAIQRGFYTDAYAHAASYLSGLVGGFVLSGITWRRRKLINAQDLAADAA